MKTKQPNGSSVDGWIKTLWYVQQWNIIEISKKGNPAICNNIHEPWGHCMEWSKPVIAGQTLHDLDTVTCGI